MVDVTQPFVYTHAMIATGTKVIVSVKGKAFTVLVTAANLASSFAGRAYNPELNLWEVAESFSYEQIVGIIVKRYA